MVRAWSSWCESEDDVGVGCDFGVRSALHLFHPKRLGPLSILRWIGLRVGTRRVQYASNTEGDETGESGLGDTTKTEETYCSALRVFSGLGLVGDYTDLGTAETEWCPWGVWPLFF